MGGQVEEFGNPQQPSACRIETFGKPVALPTKHIIARCSWSLAEGNAP